MLTSGMATGALLTGGMGGVPAAAPSAAPSVSFGGAGGRRIRGPDLGPLLDWRKEVGLGARKVQRQRAKVIVGQIVAGLERQHPLEEKEQLMTRVANYLGDPRDPNSRIVRIGIGARLGVPLLWTVWRFWRAARR